MRKISEDNFEDLIAGRSENLSLEFKSSLDISKHFIPRLKVIKAIFAMSNRENGGVVIVGIGEGKDRQPILEGMTKSHFDIFKKEREGLEGQVKSLSSAPINFNLGYSVYKERKFIIINVSEFEEYLTICTDDCPKEKKSEKILEKGAIYTRTIIDKPSSVKLVDPRDIHKLLQRVAEKLMLRYKIEGCRYQTTSKVAKKSTQEEDLSTIEKFKKESVDF